MDYRSLAILVSFIAVPALAFACGGKADTGGSDGGPGSSSSSGGMSGSSSGAVSGSSSGSVSGSSSGVVSSSTSGGEPVDATPAIDSPTITCMSNGMGGSSGGTTDGGPPPCETSESENCSDGTTYSVDCNCPQGTCTCTVMSQGGGSGGSVTYPGCPSCTTSNLFQLCAFPQ